MGWDIDLRAYTPTGPDTPNPRLLPKVFKKYLRRWVSVADALPPQRLAVLVALRCDNVPAYGWLKFAAADRRCPFFVCPQVAALGPRGRKAGSNDITHWWADSPEGLPFMPDKHAEAEWGLDGFGWQPKADP